MTPSNTAPNAPFAGQKPAIARVEVFHDMAAAETVWLALETAPDSLLSPYQRYDFLAAWQRHVGVKRGLSPLIAVGFDPEDQPVCLWPLGLRRGPGGTKVAEFLGGKHSNFNCIIWRRDLAENATPEMFGPMFDALANITDALILLNQPRNWEGRPNPLTVLPHSGSADPAYSGALMPDYEALLQARMTANKRKKLRNRERALAQYGNVTFRRADSPADARAMLTAFHEQKAQRMCELGVGNVFAEPGVAAFIEEAACNDARTIEVFALYADDQVAATCAGVVVHDRFSTMFNSITRSEMAQASPGQLLLTHLIRTLCGRGIKAFDLGVGEAQYKEIFCNDLEPLFDSFLPLTTSGRMIAAATRAAYAAKRTIKRTPALWSAVQATRRWRSRLS